VRSLDPTLPAAPSVLLFEKFGYADLRAPTLLVT
jgi:hypothetical protein